MRVSVSGTQHAVRATFLSENRPPLASSGAFRFTKTLQQSPWGKNLQVHTGFKTQSTAFTVITGRHMEKNSIFFIQDKL